MRVGVYLEQRNYRIPAVPTDPSGQSGTANDLLKLGERSIDRDTAWRSMLSEQKCAAFHVHETACTGTVRDHCSRVIEGELWIVYGHPTALHQTAHVAPGRL